MRADGDALSNVREGVREWIGLEAKPVSPLYALLAESCLAVGEITEGLSAANGGLAAIAPTLDRFAEAELWRLKGELLLARSSRQGQLRRRPLRPSEEVEGCFREALEIARRQGARAFELRAATSLVKLDRLRGIRGESHTRLGELAARLQEGLDTPDLVQAQGLLAEPDKRRPTPQPRRC